MGTLSQDVVLEGQCACRRSQKGGKCERRHTSHSKTSLSYYYYVCGGSTDLALLQSAGVGVVGALAHAELDAYVDAVGGACRDERSSQPVVDGRHRNVADRVDAHHVAVRARVACLAPLQHRSDNKHVRVCVCVCVRRTSADTHAGRVDAAPRVSCCAKTAEPIETPFAVWWTRVGHSINQSIN